MLLLTAAVAGVRNAKRPCLAANVNFMTLGCREKGRKGSIREHVLFNYNELSQHRLDQAS